MWSQHDYVVLTPEERTRNILRRIETVRSITIQKLLMLHLYITVNLPYMLALERFGGGWAKRTKKLPGLKFIMNYLGYSRRTAQDYQKQQQHRNSTSHLTNLPSFLMTK